MRSQYPFVHCWNKRKANSFINLHTERKHTMERLLYTSLHNVKRSINEKEEGGKSKERSLNGSKSASTVFHLLLWN